MNVLLCCFVELFDQRRFWSEHNMYIMPTSEKAIGEIREMALAAAERLC